MCLLPVSLHSVAYLANFSENFIEMLFHHLFGKKYLLLHRLLH